MTPQVLNVFGAVLDRNKDLTLDEDELDDEARTAMQLFLV